MTFLQAKDPHDDLQAGDDLFRHIPAQPVIRGDVGLTFAGVDDNGIHLADAAGEFDMGGEGRAAHTHDAGLPDDADQLFRSQGIHLLLSAGLNILVEGTLVIIFDDHTHHSDTAGVRLCLHRLDLTGHGCVNRHAQARIVANFLTFFHQVALFHQGLTRRADVLGHRDHQNIRLRVFLQGTVAGVPLVFLGMDTTKERKRHVASPLLIIAEKIRFSIFNNKPSIPVCPSHFLLL